MSRSSALLASTLLMLSLQTSAAPPWHALGRPVSPEEFASWDIDVRPDGAGLPPGSGSVADGQVIYDAQCASCHGTFGESNDYIALTGGIGSLASDSPQRTVGSKLDYATTLWDYINRAMPFTNSKTLSVNEVYAVTAYVLNLNEIVPADAVLDEKTLPQIRMPNRDGFTLEHGFRTIDGTPDVRNTACMKDCVAKVAITSELPPGFTAEMYGDVATHFRRFSGAAAPPPAAATRQPGHDLAEANGCLACHAVDTARVGPAFTAIGARYREDSAALQALTAKVRQGGSGVWGSATMPPQTQIPDAELATVLGWILQDTNTR